MVKKCLKPNRGIKPEVQEALKILTGINMKKTTASPLTVKLLKRKIKTSKQPENFKNRIKLLVEQQAFSTGFLSRSDGSQKRWEERQ